MVQSMIYENIQLFKQVYPGKYKFQFDCAVQGYHVFERKQDGYFKGELLEVSHEEDAMFYELKKETKKE